MAGFGVGAYDEDGGSATGVRTAAPEAELVARRNDESERAPLDVLLRDGRDAHAEQLEGAVRLIVVARHGRLVRERTAALEALVDESWVDPALALGAALRALVDDAPGVRASACRALGRLGVAALGAADLLGAMASEDRSARVRREARRAARRIRAPVR